jgi:hypothetical protein
MRGALQTQIDQMASDAQLQINGTDETEIQINNLRQEIT